MKELLSLRTVRKKLLMLSKSAGIALIISYIFFTDLPISQDISFLLWLIFVLLLVLAIDFFMGRFISKPLAQLNTGAKRMASLDLSTPCTVATTDEFGELANSLNTMSAKLQQTLSRLERSLADRQELVDSLSHEMKTPLGIIRAYAEGLQDETDEVKRQYYAQVIISEVTRMNDLIVTLLDLSALDCGAAKLCMSRFDLVESVEVIAGRLLIDAPDADLVLEYELPKQQVYVWADKRRIEQVLSNLIINAKKNVRSGGILRLTLIEDDGILRFSIFDQGKQISDDDLSKIWTRFYQGQDADHNSSGLGLFIAAQILTMHDLPYGAKNLSDGVAFTFSIPIIP